MRMLRRLDRSVAVTVLAMPLLVLAGSVGHAAASGPQHAIAMYGDVKYPADFAHFDYVNADAPKGGSLALSGSGTFDSLNPFILRGTPAAGLTLLFETLMTPSLDEPFTDYGLVAESVETPEDRSWVKFTLDPKARWHDGQPITPEDVIFSFETLTTKGHPQYRSYYANVVKAEKTGEREVTFTFDGGVNRELPLIMGQLPVLPKHYYQDRDFERTSLEPPLGSGPYKIKSFEPGRSIVYERVPDYWGKDLPVNRGRYNYDDIRYEYYRGPGRCLRSVQGRRVRSLVGEFVEALGDRLRRSDVPARGDRQGGAADPAGCPDAGLRVQPPQGQVQGSSGCGRRSTTHSTSSGRTRTCSMMPMSASKVTSTANPDWPRRACPARQNWPCSSPTATSCRRRFLLRHMRSLRPMVPATIEKTCATPFNCCKKPAGWFEDDRLVNQETGEPMQFEILLADPASERYAAPWVKNLKRLGVDARIRIVDTAQYQNRIDNFDFDVTSEIWGQSNSPGNEQRDMWGSAVADVPGSRNTAGIKNPVVDALIDKVITASSREELEAAVRALDRVLLWGHYVVPHFVDDGFRVAYWNKFSRPEILPEDGPDFMAWWVDPVKVAALQRNQPPSSKELKPSRLTRARHRRACLHPPPAAADHPDPVRDHGDQFRHRSRRRPAGRSSR